MEIIGQFNRRITIQQPSEEVNTITGQPIGTWQDVAKVWANKMSVKGRDRLLGDQTVSIGEEVFKVRYREDISPKMRVMFKGNGYEIKSVHEVGRNESMVIVCQRLT